MVLVADGVTKAAFHRLYRQLACAAEAAEPLQKALARATRLHGRLRAQPIHLSSKRRRLLLQRRTLRRDLLRRRQTLGLERRNRVGSDAFALLDRAFLLCPRVPAGHD